MSKKKAIVCTILLTIVVLIITFAICIIEIEGIYLSRIIFSLLAGSWMGEKIFEFYKWLRNNGEK